MIDYTQTYDHGPLARTRKLTRDEFVQECARISLTTPEHVLEYHEILECECGSIDCPGWRAVYLLENRRRARKAVGA